MCKVIRCLAMAIVLLPVLNGSAWNPPTDTAGPLMIEIKRVGVVKELDQPIPVEVTVRNSGEEAISGSVGVSVIDRWRVDGERIQQFTVEGKGSIALSFRVVAGKGTYSALYPIHATATFKRKDEVLIAHAVDIVQTEVAAQPAAMSPVTEIRSGGPFSLWRLRNYRVEWGYFEGAKHPKPLGWTGSDATCRCTFERAGSVRRGNREMPALVMHPPWVGGPGTIYVDYDLVLPKAQPIRLVFHNAIRDTGPNEPASDGVTFRVSAGKEKFFERHTDTKEWLRGEVDLSRFAGKRIVLRLESDPGPKKDTTCDSSYWGNPTLLVGAVPEAESREKTTARMKSMAETVVESAREAIREGKKESPGLHFFELGDGEDSSVVAVKLGKHGLLDGVFAFVNGEKELVMYGLEAAVLESDLRESASGIALTDVRSTFSDGVLRVVHRAQGQGKSFELTGEVLTDREGLRISLNCPERITDFAAGSFNEKATKVFAGMGNVIVRPAAFTLSPDGHRLSTRYVGVDFENGVSLLQAVSVPPDLFRVDPENNVYAIHTHLDGTLTLVPSAKGAFDAAMKYREIADLRASAGVGKLAGRFVFDVWGGRGYRGTANDLRKAIQYGMTDAVLIYHNWQRWGYDYRLPDIFPPNPRRGTLEEFQELARVCDKAGILFAPHDNYIDFYPDAAEYSYEAIAFSGDNQPVKAWYNQGRDAQSYRFRPDRIQPFVSRNLRLIAEHVQPTAYFIDVFSSLMPFDYYDWEGRFHPKTETQRLWGEVFEFARDCLGDNAVQISESGHDALIGWLDGATCNHLRVDARPDAWTVWRIECEDAERTPWYDVVHRQRFILHGAGYGNRYQGGLDARNHGVDSDDYIATEVLTGHPGMVSTPFSRAAVRKYWLLQDLMRSLALKKVAGVEFAGGDIHRQIVRYASGEEIYVNRGEKDWEIGERALPPYGFLARGKELEVAVEKKDGLLRDWCRSSSGLYVNARRMDHGGRPAAERPDDPRFNPEGRVVDFGPVRTNGAVRLTWDDRQMTLTPLPGEGVFGIEVDIRKVVGREVGAVKRVAVLGEEGDIGGEVNFSCAGGKLKFEADGRAFAYRAIW
jgi:hypothetical protein